MIQIGYEYWEYPELPFGAIDPITDYEMDFQVYPKLPLKNIRGRVREVKSSEYRIVELMGQYKPAKLERAVVTHLNHEQRQLEQKTYNSEGTLIKSGSFRYDAGNLLIEVLTRHEPNGFRIHRGFEYDTQGRQLKVLKLDSSRPELIANWGYDSLGRLISFKSYENDELAWERLHKWNQVENDLVEQVYYRDAGKEFSRSCINTYTQDLTLIKSIVWPESANPSEAFYRYDDHGRLLRQSIINAGNQTQFLLNWEFDAKGRLIRTEWDLEEMITYFHYDERDRMIYAERGKDSGWGERYEYDEPGNVIRSISYDKSVPVYMRVNEISYW